MGNGFVPKLMLIGDAARHWLCFHRFTACFCSCSQRLCLEPWSLKSARSSWNTLWQPRNWTEFWKVILQCNQGDCTCHPVDGVDDGNAICFCLWTCRLDISTLFTIRGWERYMFLIDHENFQANGCWSAFFGLHGLLKKYVLLQYKTIMERKLPDKLKLEIAKKIENNLFTKVGYTDRL